MEICWLLNILTDASEIERIFGGIAFGMLGMSVGIYIRDSYFKNGNDK